jgi:copper(I)-binding protein
MKLQNPGRVARRHWLHVLCAVAALLVLAPWAGAAQPAAGGAAAPTVSGAWARATPPGAGVAAVYLTVTGGSRADTLLAARTARAAMTEIHQVVEADGMAQMRPMEDGVAIPARQAVRLEPHGLHLMLMQLTQPLQAGERFTVTLRFAEAGEVDVQVEVRAPGSDVPAPTR